jgi:hypothetical protein
MGVAGDIPKGPEEKVVFMEDLNAGELAQAVIYESLLMIS